MNELQHKLRLDGLEEIRIIKDKKTGKSRQFAFAQFATIADATRLLERHYPSLTLYDPQEGAQQGTSQPVKVRIAYSRERDDRDKAGYGEDDWKCDVCYLPNFSSRTLCFRCNAPRTRASAHGIVIAQANMSAFSGFATTGDSDAALDGNASQFLLLRGLEPGVNEDLLAKGVSKLYKTKATNSSNDNQANKKTKIASTSNDSSYGAKEGSLRRVLLIRDRKTNDSWRYGFAEFSTVEDAQAAVAKYKASEKFTISSKPVMISYIHAGVFVPVLRPLENGDAQFTFSPLSNNAIKLMYWDEAAYANELVTAVAEQPSVEKRKQSEHAKRAAAAANEGLVDQSKEGEARPKKRKVEKEAKIVAPHLQFWSNRHAEIHGITPKQPEDAIPGASQNSVDNKILTDGTKPSTQSFADLNRKCCLLCSRQFKSEEDVKKHEHTSKLHRDNMKDSALVANALSKLSKSIENPNSSAYRDRAKERRQAFNQPKQPAAQHNRGSKPSTDTDAIDTSVQSKGAALLGKMGWTAGEGLGAQGTGMTDAIRTDLYSAGVGLGAQGGKLGDAAEEAQRQTTGTYADFLNKTKDKAKERFESLA
ncbi:RNA-binding, RBD [Glarea lozoyensis ATCC 20868]|uniref:RNA-binding, RBD n=1 Tax=Glarea lozoyensis (strain ATCC 20868 / MF5171) TaxID=1116229 RepID=S3DCB5_GLAL2|nr:RNA-binding, RBD [Glarea lozoyensis ATCC 20868]EPE24283.1 RNA-binding, RBD [Glarea lozoyensis ATCC 20868]